MAEEVTSLEKVNPLTGQRTLTTTLKSYKADNTENVDADGNSAANVTIGAGSSIVTGVKAGVYDEDKAVTTASQREALGGSSLTLTNLDAANFMRVRGGDITVVATLTSGYYIAPGQTKDIPFKDGDTHWAYIADTGALVASALWGG